MKQSSLIDRGPRAFGATLGRVALPLLASLLASALATAPAAQVEFGGAPASERGVLRSQAPTRTLPPVDVEELLREDRLRGPDLPFRFGARIDVDLDMRSAGVWEELEDGGRVWRLRLRSPRALALGLLFSRFQLPVDGELFVYNDDRDTVRGAYTYLNHRPNGRFAIQPTPGDAITLEYHEPAGSAGGASLAVSSVIHDYVGFDALLGAGPCHVDVTCPVAAPFADQVDATVRMSIGPFMCSGVLLNNTAQDGTQYLLTADHCGDPTDAIFTFNFQRPSCGTGSGQTNQTVQGSVVVANDPDVDLTLARIIPQIPAAYNAYLAGWDRSGVTPFATFGVHHPSGDEKAFSIDANSPNKPVGFWRVLEWDLGTTEPGSSGSGLFDPHGRVIGYLFGGDAGCMTPIDDYYSRMDVAWDRLAPFLDPLGTGQLALNGYDPDDQPALPLDLVQLAPDPIEILNPGTAQTLQIHGAGFDDTATLDIDGVLVDPGSYGWINPGLLTLDLPLLPSPGSYTLTIHDGGEEASIPLEVVTNATPTLEVGNGDLGNQVFVSARFVMAGTPGDLHFVTFSPSPLPSVHPVWMLEYGNQFSELLCLGVFTIPPSGYAIFDSPTAGTAGSTFYLSSTVVQRGLPAPVSNLQRVRVLF